MWGYGGSVPGPQIRVPQGERVSRFFVNDLPQPSTVHWHGVRIANAMDGVPELTQTEVPPGQSFLYEFDAPDAGTFWYHPHNRAWEQMARGLYGALIVEEPQPLFVDHDEVLLLDDWYLTAEAELHPSFGDVHDWAHAGRLGNWITINGEGNWTRTVRQHERWRLRLVNTSNARVFPLEVKGLAGWVVALDGQPLSFLQQLSHLELAPAQRADLVVDVLAEEGEEATLTLVQPERSSGLVIGTFGVDGVSRADRLPEPEPLPANPVPPLGDLEKALSAEPPDGRRSHGRNAAGHAGRTQSEVATTDQTEQALGYEWCGQLAGQPSSQCHGWRNGPHPHHQRHDMAACDASAWPSLQTSHDRGHPWTIAGHAPG